MLPELDALEMKNRVQLIADQLVQVLPDDVSERSAILRGLLHPDVKESLDQSSDKKGIAGWGIWPLSLVVGQHGLEAFDESMDLLQQMTRRSTAEFAIRYFLLADQERALNIMTGWATNDCHHVRRLASEGSRPRLPWAMQLPALMNNPKPTLPLLKALRDDPSPYVRRSVANHLNDISKDNPALCIRTTEQWLKSAPPMRLSLLRHACRGLIKAGDPKTLSLFGFHPPKVKTDDLVLSSHQIQMGEVLTFSITLHSTAKKAQTLAIDYVMHFRRANGTLSNKVFKGGVVTLKSGESHSFSRRYNFKPVTTRRFYSGTQALSIRINGVDTKAVEFELLQ